MISKDVIRKLIFDMLSDEFKHKSYRKDLETDIEDIVSTCEEIADYIERGRYSLTDEEKLANHQQYNSRV